MKKTRMISILTLFIGLAGSAHAFDSEGDIEDRLLASLGSSGTAAAPDDGPYAFQSEGDIHDQWFGAAPPRAKRDGKAMEARFAFESEGDLYRQSVSIN